MSYNFNCYLLKECLDFGSCLNQLIKNAVLDTTMHFQADFVVCLFSGEEGEERLLFK